MIDVFDKQSGVQIGSITEAQLQFLIDQLEEEHEKDQDYYINRATLEMLARKAPTTICSNCCAVRSAIARRWSFSGPALDE